MLTGRAPFDAETPLAVAYKHVHEAVPRPGQFVGGIPDVVDELTLVMTEREPAERPAGGAALAVLVARARRQIAMSTATERDTRVIALPAAASAPGASPSTTAATVTAAVPSLPTRLRPPPPVGPGPPAAGGPRRRRRRVIALLLLVVLTAGAAAAGWWFGEGRYRSVPSLLGVSAASAKATAAADHLSVVIAGSRVYSATYPPGRVAEQSPGVHGRIVRGGHLTLVLSRGPRKSPVPEVAGAPLATAEQALREVHLTAQPIRSAYSDTVPSGDVIRSDPQASRVIDQGKGVSLVVSKGPAPVSLPGLRGTPASTAESHLRDAGLTVRTSKAYSTTIAAGDVISQSVAAGTSVPYGSSIHLVVSKGPQYVTLPELDGDSPSQAEAALAHLGLLWTVKKFPGTPAIDVVGTSPSGGASVQVGSAITLYVF
jgi:serine/threonine-protein kinase